MHWISNGIEEVLVKIGPLVYIATSTLKHLQKNDNIISNVGFFKWSTFSSTNMYWKDFLYPWRLRQASKT